MNETTLCPTCGRRIPLIPDPSNPRHVIAFCGHGQSGAHKVLDRIVSTAEGPGTSRETVTEKVEALVEKIEKHNKPARASRKDNKQ